ncbi:DNA-directed RNA polymerase alpha chain, putative [Eimeria praecox]|uniref:DNA-directed RNA polymerase alpha chain, putative n=1 Tax=Eimeria praecox TaxID=51316 RepID=U6G0Q6_9EIME|nr:DNA-directed RNA polymerase alpha chain, putative [Eimeria praecox]
MLRQYSPVREQLLYRKEILGDPKGPPGGPTGGPPEGPTGLKGPTGGPHIQPLQGDNKEPQQQQAAALHPIETQTPNISETEPGGPPGDSSNEDGDPSRPPVSPPKGPPISPPTEAPVSPSSGAPVSPPSVPPASPASGPPVSPPLGAPVSPSSGAPVSPSSGAPVSPSSGAPVSPPLGAPVPPSSGAPVSPSSGAPVSPVSSASSTSDEDIERLLDEEEFEEELMQRSPTIRLERERSYQATLKLKKDIETGKQLQERGDGEGLPKFPLKHQGLEMPPDWVFEDFMAQRVPIGWVTGFTDD